MKNTTDKIVTGFFVLVFGVAWYFSTKQYVKPSNYEINVKDNSGKSIQINEVRSYFKTQEVAYSFLKEYEVKFPQHNFELEVNLPEFKRNTIFNKVLNNFSHR